jgi:hypothetical protein
MNVTAYLPLKSGAFSAASTRKAIRLAIFRSKGKLIVAFVIFDELTFQFIALYLRFYRRVENMKSMLTYRPSTVTSSSKSRSLAFAKYAS